MATITIIKEDGSIMETVPMDHDKARSLFNTLKNNNNGSDIYVLHFV